MLHLDGTNFSAGIGRKLMISNEHPCNSAPTDDHDRYCRDAIDHGAPATALIRLIAVKLTRECVFVLAARIFRSIRYRFPR